MTVQAERATVTSAAARRLAGLVTATWATFDEIAAALLSRTWHPEVTTWRAPPDAAACSSTPATTRGYAT